MFTPGPWTYQNLGGVHDQALIYSESDPSGRDVAVSYDKKDAPLLAAAPEMLEALRSVVEQIPWGEIDRGKLLGRIVGLLPCRMSRVIDTKQTAKTMYRLIIANITSPRRG